jgi:hypothetical protein
MSIRGAHAAGVLFSAAGRKFESVRSTVFQEKVSDMPRFPRAVRRAAEQYTRAACAPQKSRERAFARLVSTNLMVMCF